MTNTRLSGLFASEQLYRRESGSRAEGCLCPSPVHGRYLRSWFFTLVLMNTSPIAVPCFWNPPAVPALITRSGLIACPTSQTIIFSYRDCPDARWSTREL